LPDLPTELSFFRQRVSNILGRSSRLEDVTELLRTFLHSNILSTAPQDQGRLVRTKFGSKQVKSQSIMSVISTGDGLQCRDREADDIVERAGAYVLDL
jgi:hypothetical protein